MIKIIFSSSNGIGSRLLRTLLASPWSHCGLVINDTHVIDASVKGVRMVTLEQFKRGRKWAIVETECDNVQAAYDAAMDELGSSYDWSGVIGIVAGRDWQERGDWFCSELVAYALKAGGNCPVRLDADRITPRDLWVSTGAIIDQSTS